MATSSYPTFEGYSSNSSLFVRYGDSTYDDGVDFGEDNSPQNDDVDDTVSSIKPTPKRRRVMRACDECRRKKIRCDGKQSCSHCSVFAYECTYDLPTNRRRNATPQYTEFLEGQLKSATKLLQLVFPAMDFNTPGMLDHLRNRLQSQQLGQVSQPSATTPLRTGEFPKISPAQPIPLAPQQKSKERNASLDMHDEVTWDVSNQFADLNFSRRSWQCGNLDPNCPNLLSSPPASLRFSADLQASRSPTMTTGNLRASSKNKRHSLNHIATLTKASPAGLDANTANGLHQKFMFSPPSSSISSPGPAVLQTQSIDASSIMLRSNNTSIYQNNPVTMFENGESSTNGQEREARFIENIPNRRHSTNGIYHAVSAPIESYNGPARQSSGYEVQFYENMPKTHLSDHRLQRCVPFDTNDPTQPLHSVSNQFNNLLDQQAWSHALLDSGMNMNNGGPVTRNG